MVSFGTLTLYVEYFFQAQISRYCNSIIIVKQMISSRGEFTRSVFWGQFNTIFKSVIYEWSYGLNVWKINYNSKHFIKLTPDWGQLKNPGASDTMTYKEIHLTV